LASDDDDWTALNEELGLTTGEISAHFAEIYGASVRGYGSRTECAGSS
jgi:hypothetical protein